MSQNSYFPKIIVVLFLLLNSIFAKVKLPQLISNGMVLQRKKNIHIWGWADTNEQVEVSFHNSNYSTKANEEGQWIITLPKFEAGGPFTMEIQGENKITVRDIMIGEVWVSSGQSNMELPMYRVSPLYQSEITYSRNDSIRYFDVPLNYNFDEPQNDTQGGKWKSADPKTVPHFSALAYFYAKNIYQKYNVPVGIINSSVGGSPAQAWCSSDILKKNFPKYYRVAQKFKDASQINKIQNKDNKRITQWHELKEKDKGYKSGQSWSDSDVNTEDWSKMNIPGFWANTELGSLNGVVWFRKKIELIPNLANKPAKLSLGRIVDADSVFINGKFIGNTTYKYPPRRYEVPSSVLKRGTNIITIRVVNQRGKGGFIKDKPYKLRFGNKSIDLKGEWKCRLGARVDPLEGQTFIKWKPVGLYNGMVAPLLNYKIRGVIWYQGESNTGQPREYEKLFKSMIKNWRQKWNQKDLPFLYVQLANFMKPDKQPSPSNWAMLRESQTKTLSLENTGMAVITDLGIWNDIHPLNKKDVAHRLFLPARKLVYGEKEIVSSGPMYESMKIRSNKAIISFDHVGKGLLAKGDGGLKHFAIAGQDSNFVWSEAKIQNNKVVVWSEKVENPIAVRYGWADNPRKANLYNKKGLPASPFRTDDWSK